MASPNLFSNLGANNTLHVGVGPVSIFSLTCDNENAADHYLQLFNHATVPVNTNVPVIAFRVPSLGQIVIGSDFFSFGGFGGQVLFPLGLAFAWSSTKDTLTLGTATDHSTWITYA